MVGTSVPTSDPARAGPAPPSVGRMDQDRAPLAAPPHGPAHHAARGTPTALLTALLTALFAVVPAANAARAGPTGDDVRREVQAYLDDAVAQGLPGLSVSVTRDGATELSAGAGTSDGTAIDSGTRTRVESVSKTFTSAAVMLLVERGAVDLDDPVTRHLPELRLADGRQDEITVRQLLNHSSGLADATAARDEYAPGPRTLEAAVATLAGARLAADPGTAYGYHNAGYWVAARLVEVVDGRPFADVLAEELFAPLGMDDTAPCGCSPRWRAHWCCRRPRGSSCRPRGARPTSCCSGSSLRSW